MCVQHYRYGHTTFHAMGCSSSKECAHSASHGIMTCLVNTRRSAMARPLQVSRRTCCTTAGEGLQEGGEARSPGVAAAGRGCDGGGRGGAEVDLARCRHHEGRLGLAAAASRPTQVARYKKFSGGGAAGGMLASSEKRWSRV